VTSKHPDIVFFRDNLGWSKADCYGAEERPGRPDRRLRDQHRRSDRRLPQGTETSTSPSEIDANADELAKETKPQAGAAAAKQAVSPGGHSAEE
jgi:hypothetical protein